jgi:hypothetical protein
VTFVVKVRGSPPCTAIADYECPVHGRFELTVPRDPNGDPPSVVVCLVPADVQPENGFSPCGHRAEYRISAPLVRVRRVEAVKGAWQKPERKTFTDTRNLGEGQPLHEWKEDRARVWEEKRKEDVVRFAREHNESMARGSG